MIKTRNKIKVIVHVPGCYNDQFNVKHTASLLCADNLAWSNTGAAVKRKVTNNLAKQKVTCLFQTIYKKLCWQTIVVKVYHVLQPSPAGNLWPTLYTLRPLRHTGRTVSNLAYMPTAF